MHRRLSTILGFVTALGLATSAYAVLGPTKASQLATVTATGTCALPGFSANTSATFTNAIHPDGTSSPFAIPAKQVFVITDVTLTVSGQQANDAMLSLISVGTASGASQVAGQFETAGATGAVKSVFTFPAGVAVKSTSLVCASMINTTHGGSVFLSGTMHGYFAPDK